MTRLSLAFLFTLSVGLLPAATAEANLLSNGSFETPDASGGDVAGAPGAPWIGFNDPGVRFTTQAEAFDGVQSAKTFGPFDFIGGGVGAVQAVPATPGVTYVGEIMALQQSGDPLIGGNFGVYKLEFLDGGGALVDVGSGAGTAVAGLNVFESNPFDASSPVDDWTLLGVGGVAPAGTASVQAVLVQVQLGDGAGGFTGGAIFWDAASVVAVPEPASLSLIGLAGAGLVGFRRKRA